MINKKYSELQNNIKVKFNNVELLKESLVHKSFSNIKNNEKLEFLGDRVLGLILAQKLLKIYPGEKEGIIDKKFSNLVNKKTCAQVAKIIDLKKYMVLGASYKGQNRSDDKILSDGLEALIGAIYIDRGLEISEKFILKFWNDYLEKSIETIVDSKTTLQEYSLKKFKELPKYKIYKQTGPQHNPIFKVEVKINDSKSFVAKGNSKKSAQQKAAKRLLNYYNI
jgi:ribonuclease III